MKVNIYRVRSILLTLLLAVALGVAAEFLTYVVLYIFFPKGTNGSLFLALFHSPSLCLLDRFMPDWFDYYDELSGGQQLFTIFWVLPVLFWAGFFLPIIYFCRRFLNSRRKISVSSAH